MHGYLKEGEKVLNNLLTTYLKASVEDKNRIADSFSISFIDDRLVIVTQELSGVEKNIQQFKQDNELGDIESQFEIIGRKAPAMPVNSCWNSRYSERGGVAGAVHARQRKQ